MWSPAVCSPLHPTSASLGVSGLGKHSYLSWQSSFSQVLILAGNQTAPEPHTQHQHAAAPTDTYSHLFGTPKAPYLHKLFPYTQHLPAPLLSAPQHLSILSTGTRI
ncbi:hypothetical protein E2C01_004854 [Portunus trituberculatus]|uniref:Uncharacterized protein n=1 Tax=Portunus trituberculatus TaxID=210409 RepID=A0A5B7CV15_PORTR|nr:hypothetical protein [Portunus trituberculatus]